MLLSATHAIVPQLELNNAVFPDSSHPMTFSNAPVELISYSMKCRSNNGKLIRDGSKQKADSKEECIILLRQHLFIKEEELNMINCIKHKGA